MPSLQVSVIAVSGGAAGKSYTIKLTAGGKEFKSGKSKKDGSFGETITVEGSPDSITIAVLSKEKVVGSANVNVSSQADGEDVKASPDCGGVKVQLSLKCVGYGSKAAGGDKPKAPPKKKSPASPTGSSSELPMPTERLNHLYGQLLDEMGVSPEVRAQMMSMPDTNKYALLSQKKLMERERDTSASLDQKPQFWLAKLKAEPNVDTLKKLQIRLSHELVSWLTEFHAIGGVSELINVLNNQNVAKKKTEDESLVSKALVQCLTAFMDNQAGLNLVNETPKALSTIAATYVDKSLDYDTRTQAIKLLSVVTLVDGGHENVLAALNELQDKTGEKSRFNSIVKSIQKTRDMKLRVVLMTFLNAVCNRPDDLITRVNLRAELSSCGFDDVLIELHKVEDSVELDTQVQVYEEEKNLDEEEQRQRFAHVPEIKLEDTENVFTGLKTITKSHHVDDYFLEVLQTLLAIRFDSSAERAHQQWALATKLLRYIGGMKMRKDAASTDTEKLLSSLLKSVQGEASEHFELVELKEAQAKSSRELATKNIEVQEKSDQIKKLEEELSVASSKAAAAAAELEEARKAGPAGAGVAPAAVVASPRVGDDEMEKKNRALKSDVERLNAEVASLKDAVAAANAAAAAAAAAGPAAAGGPPPPPPMMGGGPPPPPPPGGMDGGPPPPPPMMGGGPPPPPPMMGGGPPPPPPPGMGGPPGPPPPPGGGPPGPPPPPGMGGPPPPPGMGGPPPPMMGKMAAAAPKKRPEVIPTQKVRNFQWTKLPEAKVRGTIFADMPLELSSLKIDYTAVEAQFAQVERAAPAAGAAAADAPKKKEGPLSILDPKTSQNLSIFLNGFKQFKFSQVANSLQNLDDSIVTGQQVTTLGVVWPTPEDIAQVVEYQKEGGDVSKLAPAEQFVLEVNQVPALQQRLKAFRFKSDYETKKSEIKPDIANIHAACKQVRASEKFRILLEIILSLGNFLNQGGNKGQAWGYKLRDLQKLTEAKTTDNKSTLMVVLVELVQKEKPELLEVVKELDALEAAARVNIQQLQSELAKLTKELEVVKGSVATVPSAGADDTYHAKVTEFTTTMTDEVAKMNADFAEMQSAYESVVTFFVEDPKAMGPDEFFALFIAFTKSLDDTVKKLEAARIAAEKAEKRGAAKAAGGVAGAKKVGLPGLAGAKKGMAPPGQGAVVNELFGQLAAGNPFKNRRRAGDDEAPPESPKAPETPKEAPESPKAE